MGDDAEARQNQNVNFRVTKEPEQMLEQDRIAGLVMPPMDSLPLAQQQELISVAKSIAPAETQTQSRASGRLASTFAAGASAYASSGSQLETLPARQEVEPQRFWIRQPD